MHVSMQETTPSCVESTTRRLSVSGDQGNVWHQAQVSLPASSNPYKLVIKSTHGSGGLGDTAIDDLKLESGNCTCKYTMSYIKQLLILVCAHIRTDLILLQRYKKWEPCLLPRY